MLRKLRFWHWLWAMAAVGAVMLSIPLHTEFYGSPLDVRFWYTGAEALRYLSSLDAETARRYLFHEVLDLGFMAFYSGFFWSAWPADARRWRKLSFVPGFLDLVETSGIMALLLVPDLGIRDGLGGIIATATPIKYVAFYASLAGVVMGWSRHRIRVNRAKERS